MNSAATLSSKLLQKFDQRQTETASIESAIVPRYPFGGVGPGPFGGASNTMSRWNDMDMSRGGSMSTNLFASDSQISTSFGGGYERRTDPSQYDYPAGWGAQTQPGIGGLTQDSATRLATLQAKLNQKLGPEFLSQRPGPGGGKKLTYVEGWKLVDLANEVFGFNGWSTNIVRLDVDYLDCSADGSRFNAGVSCIVRVTLRDGAFHEDVGYGNAENTRQKHAALEKCKKEAVTDATKRALKNFGKLLGNCTYDQKFAKEAFKVAIPVSKFDPSELHRRHDTKPPPPPPPLPPPPQHQRQPQPPEQQRSNSVQTETSRPTVDSTDQKMAPPKLMTELMGPPAPTTNSKGSGNAIPRAAAEAGASASVSSPTAVAAAPNKGGTQPSPPTEDAKLGGVLDQATVERQNRSLMAKMAYLERQLAVQKQQQQQQDHRGSKDGQTGSPFLTTTMNTSTTTTMDASTEAQGSSSDIGLSEHDDQILHDSIDDASFQEMLVVGYDETETRDAEAASMAIEMGIETDKANDSELFLADDSGIAFVQDPLQPQQQQQNQKQKQARAMKKDNDNGSSASSAAAAVAASANRPAPQPQPQRRSMSPIKQVKQDDLRTRRAGSVGRFLSPPPVERSGLTSLHAAAEAGARALERNPPQPHQQMGNHPHPHSVMVAGGGKAVAPTPTTTTASASTSTASFQHRRGIKRSIEGQSSVPEAVVQRAPLQPLATDETGSIKRNRS